MTSDARMSLLRVRARARWSEFILVRTFSNGVGGSSTQVHIGSTLGIVGQWASIELVQS